MNENTENLQDFDDDGWADDIDLSDLADEPEGEANESESEQQAAETTETAEPAEAPAYQPEPTVEQPTQETPEQADNDADQRFELKHLDERKTVTLEEMKTLAQKGMDYDRIRQERDDMRVGWDFLKELAGNRPVQDLIDEARAAQLVEAQGIDRQTAMERVKLDRERKLFEERRQQAEAERTAQQNAASAAEAEKAAHEKWRQDCFMAFSKEFPDVDPKSIPKEVWNQFQNGETLVSAYRGYRLKELETEMKNKQQAEDAAQRSTGSQQTAGASDKDEFDALWYDGT